MLRKHNWLVWWQKQCVSRHNSISTLLLGWLTARVLAVRVDPQEMYFIPTVFQPTKQPPPSVSLVHSDVENNFGFLNPPPENNAWSSLKCWTLGSHKQTACICMTIAFIDTYKIWIRRWSDYGDFLFPTCKCLKIFYLIERLLYQIVWIFRYLLSNEY